MNFPQRNKKSSTGKKLLVGFLAFAVFVFALNTLTKGGLSSIARVPATALWGANGVFEESLTGFKNVFKQKETVQKENELLKDRIDELELYALNNLVLVSENEELRKLLGTDASDVRRGILARVLSRGGAVPYGTMVISRDASTANFPVGALVFGRDNIVIGKVVEVSGTNAVIKLLAAHDVVTSALVVSENAVTEVQVVGTGNGNMTVQVAREVQVAVNDPVVLFTEETSILGFIGDIETKPTDAFKILRIRTPLNLEAIRFVRVR